MNDPNQEANAVNNIVTGQFDATPEPQLELPVLTLYQTKMFESMPIGSENARLARDIALGSGFTVKYGRKLIACLYARGIINWVPKGRAARYKKWYRPQDA